jgi:hypothetical protein
MPRPLRYVGLHTVVQATLHLPLVPAQMKACHRGEARDLLPAPASSHRRVGGDTPPVAGKLPRRSKPSAAVAAHWRAAAAARGGAQQGCCLQSPAPSTLFPFPPSELALSMVVGGRCGRNGQIHALHGRIRVLPTWIRAQGAGAVEASRAWWPAAAAAGQPPLWLFQGAARGGVLRASSSRAGPRWTACDDAASPPCASQPSPSAPFPLQRHLRHRGGCGSNGS